MVEGPRSRSQILIDATRVGYRWLDLDSSILSLFNNDYCQLCCLAWEDLISSWCCDNPTKKSLRHELYRE